MIYQTKISIALVKQNNSIRLSSVLFQRYCVVIKENFQKKREARTSNLTLATKDGRSATTRSHSAHGGTATGDYSWGPCTGSRTSWWRGRSSGSRESANMSPGMGQD